jgi:histidinol dehydrogenase
VDLEVTRREIDHAGDMLPPELKEAIGAAAETIRSFHQAQIPPTIGKETRPGVYCRREWRPIQRVGLYAPGGSAPLISTVLMLGIPATLAGCREILLCSPPNMSGEVEPGILYAARLAGVRRIFRAGGAQAIAAMSAGTETIPKVDKIFGPGNRFVAAAKARVSVGASGVEIDMLAGPTELLIIADDSANPRWVAADLLAQAEHGVDSRVVLVTTHSRIADAVEQECELQLPFLSRRQTIRCVLEAGPAIVVRTLSDAIEFSNRFAPEHLALAVREGERFVPKIQNAGAVFVGAAGSSVFGDYASGPNHTLPTGGTAVCRGGLTLESFMKPLFIETFTSEGVRSMSPIVMELARAERLDAHARAAEIRGEIA